MQAQSHMVPELAKIYVLLFGALLVSAADVKLWLQIGAPAMVILYTAWKWHRDWRRDSKGKK